MHRRYLILLIVFGCLLLASPTMAESVSVDFLPSLYIERYPASHVINNYTIESSSGTTGAMWQLLGTNDEQVFDLLDSRKDVDFVGGVSQQFNISNSNSYSRYYVYAVEGFALGSTLTIHFDQSGVSLSPKESFTPYFNFTEKRTPFVAFFDFSKNPGDVSTVLNYTVESSDNLGNVQSWVLYGTNSTSILGTDNSGLFTQVDTQSSVGFTGGVPNVFDITGQPQFSHYVIYSNTGFDLASRLNFRFRGEPLIHPPVASFTANRSGDVGFDPQAIKFTDTSTGSPYAWAWYAQNMSDPAILFSNSQNPEKSFTVGNWSIILVVSNLFGSNQSTQTTWINVSAKPPVAGFSGTPTLGTIPLFVSFTDESLYIPTSWNWSFGDGNYSELQNPSHIYAWHAMFTVGLTACNPSGCDTLVKPNYITASVLPPVINETTSYYSIVSNTSYVPAEGYIPFEVWLLIVIAGAAFLIISLLVPRGEIISSLIATVLFGVGAYVALVMVIIGENIKSTDVVANTTLVNGTSNVSIVSVIQPVNYSIGSVWLSLLCLGLCLIAALKVIMSISDLIARAGEEADEVVADRERIKTEEAADVRTIASERFGPQRRNDTKERKNNMIDDLRRRR